MSMTHLYDLKNSEMAGTLDKKLRLWRKQGKSFRTIAAELSELGTYVNHEVIRTWCEGMEKGTK